MLNAFVNVLIAIIQSLLRLKNLIGMYFHPWKNEKSINRVFG